MRWVGGVDACGGYDHVKCVPSCWLAHQLLCGRGMWVLWEAVAGSPNFKGEHQSDVSRQSTRKRRGIKGMGIQLLIHWLGIALHIYISGIVAKLQVCS